MDIMTLDGIDLKKLVARRHPDYEKNIDHWKFAELAYRGGRAWFDAGHLFRFYKEGEEEYKDRVKRAYRANHTKRVVETVNQYLFRESAVRDRASVPAYIGAFWDNTGNHKPISQLAREIDRWVSVFGGVYVIVDRRADDPALDSGRRADETAPYAYLLFPKQALDMAYDGHGELVWFLAEEDYRPISLVETGVRCRWRLWTRTHWFLIEREVDAKGNETDNFYVAEQGEHGLEAVPVVPVFAEEGAKYSATGMIADTVYMDRTLVNYGALLDEILYEQTFSQLVMPAEAILPGTSEMNQIINLAKKRVFLYNSTTPGAMPSYISPDASQAGVLITSMQMLKRDIYAVTGTDNDANSQSMSKGKEYASGKVRQFDHTQIENTLLSKARTMERAEEEILRLVIAWMGRGDELNPEWVAYPEKFDIRGLAAELEIASELTELEAPIGLLREQMKLVVDKTFPRMSVEERAERHAEIETWQPRYVFDREMEEEDKKIARFVAETQADAMKDSDPGNDESVDDASRQDLKPGGDKSPA